MFPRALLSLVPSLSSICSTQVPSIRQRTDIILIWITVSGIAGIFALLANSLMALFAAQSVAARSQLPQTNIFSDNSTARIQIAALTLNVAASVVLLMVLIVVIIVRREQVKLSKGYGGQVRHYMSPNALKRLRWTILWSGITVNCCSDIATLAALISQEKFIRPLHTVTPPAPLAVGVSLIVMTIIFQCTFFTPSIILLRDRLRSRIDSGCELSDSTSYVRKVPGIIPPSPTLTVTSSQERALLGPSSDTTSARMGSFLSHRSFGVGSMLLPPAASPIPSRSQSPIPSLRLEGELPPPPPQTPPFGSPPPPPTLDPANIHPLFRALAKGPSSPSSSVPRCSAGTSIVANPHHKQPLSVEKLTALRPMMSNASLRKPDATHLAPPAGDCHSVMS